MLNFEFWYSQEDRVHTSNLKRAIVTLQYTYTIHYDIQSIWKLTVLPLEILIFDLLISLTSTLVLSDLYFHLASCHPSRFYYLTLSLGIGYSLLKPVACIRVRSESVVDLWCAEKRCEVCLSSLLILGFSYHPPALFEFRGWNFYKVGRV